MTELSYLYPEGGEPRSSSDGLIRTALVGIKETVNGKLGAVNLESATVTDAKLASPNNSAYRLLAQSMTVGIGGATEGTHVPTVEAFTSSGEPSMSEGAPVNPLIPIKSTDYAVSGKTTKIRLKMQLVTGNVTPSAAVITGGLYKPTISAGKWALGEPKTTVASSGLAKNTPSLFEGSDLALPEDGLYLFAFKVTGATVASVTTFAMQLQIRNT